MGPARRRASHSVLPPPSWDRGLGRQSSWRSDSKVACTAPPTLAEVALARGEREVDRPRGTEPDGGADKPVEELVAVPAAAGDSWSKLGLDFFDGCPAAVGEMLAVPPSPGRLLASVAMTSSCCCFLCSSSSCWRPRSATRSPSSLLRPVVRASGSGSLPASLVATAVAIASWTAFHPCLSTSLCAGAACYAAIAAAAGCCT